MFSLIVGGYFVIGLALMFFFFYLVGRHECVWHKRSDRIPCIWHFELELSAMASVAVWPIVLFMWAFFGIVSLVAIPLGKFCEAAQKLGRKA